MPFYVYIATNLGNTVLYTGVTNNILRRMNEHKKGLLEGFTKKYKVSKLVFVEEYNSPADAIAMEKKIKGWTRDKKIALIKAQNPNFLDFARELD